VIIKFLIDKGAIIITENNCRYIIRNIVKKADSDYIIKILNNKETKFIIYENYIILF
jgi:hypothetical protein